MLGPTLDDGHQLLLGDAGNFQQTLRLLIENPERIFAERLDDARRDALAVPLISPEARYSLMPSAVAGSRLSKESICTCLPKRALFTHRPLMRRDAPA